MDHGKGFKIMLDYLIPGILLTVSCTALFKNQDGYSALLEGGAQGLKILLTLVPSLVLLSAALSMLRTSGALDILTKAFSPFFHFFGIPPETLPLVLIRPVSGSAALAAGAEIMTAYGPDSQIGRTCAVMLGSTETTFYTLCVYFGAAGIRKSRYTLPAAILADLTGFCMAAVSVRLFLP